MSATQTLAGNSRREVAVSAFLVGIVAIMIVPLPPILVDLGLGFSILLGLLTFLVAIHVHDPLELSVFPSLVLIATLLRLALNVATTRLILLHGAEGSIAAGSIIRSFGSFVVGGNYAVGVILFLILVVINFVVITKGAGRVAEVSARFSLDAMPGKQMAIDADLGAGLIKEGEAKIRRERIQDEADFHGAMDGASKFVRGDAIAGLVITAINGLAGLAVGALQYGMPVAEAAETFTILTVGDGLVSQIPALLMSTASAIVVTRGVESSDLGSTLIEQLTARRKALEITGVFLVLLGLLPGMPHLTFLVLAAGVIAVSRIVQSTPQKGSGQESEHAPSERREESEQEQMERLLPIDLLELEIGYELVGAVDESRDGNLLARISGIRRNFASEMGVIIPPVHIRDNLQLKPGEYRLLLSGNEIGGGEVRVGRFLAMDPTGDARGVHGEAVTEPAFGLPARWIVSGDRSVAETRGYTVVDAPTVVATHLSEVIRKNAHELLGRREVQELLDIFAKSNPNVVDELIPNILPLSSVIKVLRRLLVEGVSIRDLRTILETLADQGGQIKDPELLTELVRQRMATYLSARVRSDDGQVHALIIDPQIESDLRQAIRLGAAEGTSFDTHAVPRILSALEEAMGRLGSLVQVPVLLVSHDLRPAMAAFAGRYIPGLSVYSYREIDPNTPVRTVAIAGADQSSHQETKEV